MRIYPIDLLNVGERLILKTEDAVALRRVRNAIHNEQTRTGKKFATRATKYGLFITRTA